MSLFYPTTTPHYYPPTSPTTHRLSKTPRSITIHMANHWEPAKNSIPNPPNHHHNIAKHHNKPQNPQNLPKLANLNHNQPPPSITRNHQNHAHQTHSPSTPPSPRHFFTTNPPITEITTIGTSTTIMTH